MKAKEKRKKYKELWSKIRNLIRLITKNSDDYDEKYMKIKFSSDGELPLNKTIEIPSMTIVVRAIFYKNNKYYAQVFLDELKEIDIKNRACYYFDDKIKHIDISFSNILLDEKLYENISVYDISYKTSKCPKPLHIRFDKIDRFIEIHNKIRYLILSDYSYCDKICNKIKYLISEKSSITDSINHNFGKIRIDPNDSLPTEKNIGFS